MGDTEDIDDYPPTPADQTRLSLITSVLLGFAAQDLTGRTIRPACSNGIVYHCLGTTGTTRCVYCALAQARRWYTLMTGLPAAELAEALALAQTDAERYDLHRDRATDEHPTAIVLARLAYDRLRSATAELIHGLAKGGQSACGGYHVRASLKADKVTCPDCRAAMRSTP